MALAAYGVGLYLLNHKQTAVSLLKLQSTDVSMRLLTDGAVALSSLIFCAYFGELHFRRKNLLLQPNLPKLGKHRCSFVSFAHVSKHEASSTDFCLQRPSMIGHMIFRASCL